MRYLVICPQVRVIFTMFYRFKELEVTVVENVRSGVEGVGLEVCLRRTDALNVIFGEGCVTMTQGVSPDQRNCSRKNKKAEHR